MAFKLPNKVKAHIFKQLLQDIEEPPFSYKELCAPKASPAHLYGKRGSNLQQTYIDIVQCLKRKMPQFYVLILNNWKVPPGPYAASLLMSGMSGK
eukprot:2182249-Ditylum_brightwellii.AAC.1